MLPALKGDARPLECSQRAGDVMFVPQNWGHGIYNTRQSVGIAVELLSKRVDAPAGYFRDTQTGDAHS